MCTFSAGRRTRLVPVLLLLLVSGGHGARLEEEKQFKPASTFLSLREGEEKVAATTTTTTTTTPADVNVLLTRMTKVQELVKALDAKVTSLNSEADKVGAQMSMTGTSLQKSMAALLKITAESSGNQKLAGNLTVQGNFFEGKAVESNKDMDLLMKQVTALEMNTKTAGSQSTSLGGKMTKLEDVVKNTLPGVGTVSTRLDKVEKDLKTFQEELKKGIESQIGTAMKATVEEVRGQVTGMAKELEQRQLKENE